MDATSHGYSKAQALRAGGSAPVRQALLETRERTLQLADAYQSALGRGGLQVPYAPELNPPLWEWGHVAWFQEHWIARNRQRALGAACDPEHEWAASLLPQADRWYDSSRVEHHSRWSLPLPDAAATRSYLASTLVQTLDWLDRLPADASDAQLYFFRLVVLHEAMHAEAAAYMGRALGVASASAAGGQPRDAACAVLSIPAQAFRLGAPDDGFAFDNERGAHEVALQAFEIDAQPVSWAGFRGFVEAGGYRERRWWSEAGWAWLRQRGGRAAEVPPDALPQAPAVHLSAHEAEAWCRWAGRRLPTEAEWECAALQSPGFTWGEVWEWTASTFEPYPGFSADPYREYSQPWFGDRRVLRGACRDTSPWLAHPRYRNFFLPQRTDLFAGFRSCA
ncbi:MAG: SUMF1/EgtB/PvdO family nonheme iron enzyme [Ramlibacter sp.]